jgi:hypothetical protein
MGNVDCAEIRTRLLRNKFVTHYHEHKRCENYTSVSNTMELSCPWKANSRSPGPQINLPLQKSKHHYYVRNSPLLVPIPSQTKPGQNLRPRNLRSTLIRSSNERCGWVINTPSSYSGGPVYKSRPVYWLLWLFFRSFPQSLQANAGTVH